MRRLTLLRLVIAVPLLTPATGLRPAPLPESGGRIAYASAGSIWTVRPDGSDHRRLTASNGDTSPAWSRDGKQLAFIRKGSGAYNAGALHVMDADGRAERGLVTETCWSPLWSPLSDEIAYVRADRGGEVPATYIAFVNSRGRATRKPVLHLEINDRHATTTHELCDWSRDGARLSARLRGYVFLEIESIALAGRAALRLGSYQHVVEPGRQRWFLFHGWRSRGGDLLVQQQLTSPAEHASASETGRYGNVIELSIGSEGSPHRRVLARLERVPGGASPMRACWSPDGKQIVFESQGRIFVTDVENPQPRLLAEGTHPRWSPR